MTKTNKRPVREGVSYLIESELERAELVLAAKAITDKLQGMAEDLAKVEADEIMPILDQLRETFGVQVAERFNSVATERVRATIEAIKAAKDGIGAEITRLETGVAGDVPNDMAVGDPALGDDAADPALAGDAPLPAPDEAGMPDDLPPEDDEAMADADGVDDAAIDAAFDDETSGAAGRAKKESAERKGNPLAESNNPDALVLSAFRNALHEGVAPTIAARGVAVSFDIDVDDVIRIVRESARKVKESVTPQRRAELQKMGFGVAKGQDGKFFWSKANDKKPGATPPKPEEKSQQEGTSANESDAWADLDSFVGTGTKPGQKPPFMESSAKATVAWKVIAEDAKAVLAEKPKLTLEQVVQALMRKHGMTLAEAGGAYRAVVQRVMAEGKKGGKKPDADKDGVPNWADKNPFKKGAKKDERKVDEAKKAKKSDPCWDGYEQVGMKKKGKKEVPNCVPKKKIGEASDEFMQNRQRQAADLLRIVKDTVNSDWSVVNDLPGGADAQMELIAGRLVARHVRQTIERLKFDGHKIESLEQGSLSQVKFVVRGDLAGMQKFERTMRALEAATKQ